MKEQRICADEDCGWVGETDRIRGTPLCPDCGDCTESLSVLPEKPYASTGVSMWIPMTDPVLVAVIGKLGEEASELATVSSRCIIQGVHASEPTTGKPNRVWLEDEIADVLAGIELAMETFVLDHERIASRTAKKKAGLLQWHAMIADEVK